MSHDGEVRRLGKRELGRHAFEEQMPQRVAAVLAHEDRSNKLDDVMLILEQELDNDRNVRSAYLCGRSITQIWKLKGEGNHFCGYRNIQMTVPNMKNKTVIEIQELIENAWNAGFNAQGKTETGGVRGTRKHIGTSEAQALLESLNIPSRARVFAGSGAHRDLMRSIEEHFSSDPASARGDRIVTTTQPPVYLQMPAHSITVVGIVRMRSSSSLLVFDPGVPAPDRFRSAGQSGPFSKLSFKPLWRYYRKTTYLSRHKHFETLHVLQGEV